MRKFFTAVAASMLMAFAMVSCFKSNVNATPEAAATAFVESLKDKDFDKFLSCLEVPEGLTDKMKKTAEAAFLTMAEAASDIEEFKIAESTIEDDKAKFKFDLRMKGDTDFYRHEKVRCYKKGDKWYVKY